MESYPTLALPRCTPRVASYDVLGNRMKFFNRPSDVLDLYYFFLFTLLYSTLTLIADRIPTLLHTH
jgi:hypothetical protein